MSRAAITTGLLLLTTTGCSRIRDAEELSAPGVAQGLYLGVNLPEGVVIEDGGDLLSYTAACTAFLAYVSDPAALADSPLEGAGVQFRSAENNPMVLEDEGDGRYLVTAEKGLVYEPDDTAVLNFEVDGEPAQMSVETPEAPLVDISPYMLKNEGFTVDISDQGYDNLIVAVYDIQRSKLVFDNLPMTVGETYAYTHTETPTESVDVPDDTLSHEGSFLVGVAGMVLADANDFQGVNQTLSAFMAGQFALHYVVVDSAS